jgi:hypothetical protein
VVASISDERTGRALNYLGLATVFAGMKRIIGAALALLCAACVAEPVPVSYPPQVSATYPPTYPTYWPYAGYYPAYYPYYSSPFWGPQVGIGAGFFFGGHRHHRGFGHGHGRHFR